MKVIIQNKDFIGDKGKEHLYQLLDLLDTIDKNSMIQFDNCNFDIRISQEENTPGTLRKIVIEWIVGEEAKRIKARA